VVRDMGITTKNFSPCKSEINFLLLGVVLDIDHRLCRASCSKIFVVVSLYVVTDYRLDVFVKMKLISYSVV
jgi:hypothetical protein